MATANPYTGQQGSEWYALAWDQGYAYGQQNPAENQPSPPTIFPPLDVGDDYLGYMQQVWSEGALAGQTDSAQSTPAPAAAGGTSAGGGSASAGGGGATVSYDDALQMCRYPSIYVQDGATAPGTPYQLERSGVDGVEVAESAVHIATMVPDAADLAWNTAQWAIWRPAAAAASSDPLDAAIASSFAAEADSAAAAAIASAGALSIGMFIFAITLTEPVYYCCDICPTCYNAATENASVDPQARDYSQLCTLELNHADQHDCPEQHTWYGSPVGFNSLQRATQH